MYATTWPPCSSTAPIPKALASVCNTKGFANGPKLGKVKIGDCSRHCLSLENDCSHSWSHENWVAFCVNLCRGAAMLAKFLIYLR